MIAGFAAEVFNQFIDFFVGNINQAADFGLSFGCEPDDERTPISGRGTPSNKLPLLKIADQTAYIALVN